MELQLAEIVAFAKVQSKWKLHLLAGSALKGCVSATVDVTNLAAGCFPLPCLLGRAVKGLAPNRRPVVAPGYEINALEEDFGSSKVGVKV